MSGHAKSSYQRIGDLLSQVANAVGGLLFITAFVGFIVQIFFRYVIGDPLRWTEEFTMIAFIWTVFWAAAFVVPIREHVSFDVVYDVVSPQTQRIFAVFSMVMVIIAFGILIPHTIEYLDFLTRRKSPVMRLPMHWIYGCYLLFIAGFALKAAARLVHLIGPDWRTHI
ncbi:TRAP transporter small permease [Roseinatronobacter alkalisoli]|uniref:TRAP transporter small permease protein n=1 Tax=Roseinatronobacter alkalisoli TaxID=3028235 RepID=A0ABT5T6C7_9RHOB|nr:TRAP transporter small permease [Roseinatronobacter sp. HJB301]MDD7970265.1 TRAP transporter small permease [Roseinatronobacter sp. HJB301]